MAQLPYTIPYDPAFLSDRLLVPMPVPRCEGKLFASGQPLDYIHYSLVMHEDRRTAVLTAHNIDRGQKKSVPRSGWDLDDRAGAAQIGNEAYKFNDWDRGHLVRRAAVAWGTRQRAQEASDSTMYYTNSALQHARFNQDEWLHLEDWVLDTASDISNRLCVFTGPIWTKGDQDTDRGFRIPSAFFKVVVVKEDVDGEEDLAVLGFVMKQNEMWKDWNGAAALDLHTYQVGIQEIGQYTNIDFGELANLDDFEWRGARFRDRSRMQPIPIRKPSDIQLTGTNARRARGRRAIPRGAPPQGPQGGGSGGTARSGSTSTGQSDCGCSDTASVLAPLRDEMTAMRALLDQIMDDMAKPQDPERAAERAELQRNYYRIVGGAPVAAGTYPECACIGNDDDWFCTGVLIAPNIVLTAGHCAPNITRVFLKGRSILLSSQGEEIGVKAVHVHPDYDMGLVPANDIALLILERDSEVEPIQLATRAEVDAADDTVLVGFGYDDPERPWGFGTKREANVGLPTGLVSPEELHFLEADKGFDNRSEFYAGAKDLGVDSCNGDSGGPAYVMVENELRLAGLTSRAARDRDVNCGDGGIYTRVTAHLEWIAEVTGVQGFPPPGADAEREDAPQAPTGGAVHISAAVPNPDGTDQGNERVELTNTGNEAQDLGGWKLQDRQDGSEPLDGGIDAGGKRWITLASNSRVKLSNSGDLIRLVDRDGAVVHEVSYPRAGSGDVLTFDAPAGGGGGNAGGGDPGADPGAGAGFEPDPC